MDYETEAIKAQAVAAHTYALRMKEANTGTNADLKGADFGDDPSNTRLMSAGKNLTKCTAIKPTNTGKSAVTRSMR